MITLNPDQLYRTLELESEEFTNQENAGRRTFNIQQITEFKNAVADWARGPLLKKTTWKTIDSAPTHDGVRIIVALFIDSRVQWVSDARLDEDGRWYYADSHLNPTHWLMEI